MAGVTMTLNQWVKYRDLLANLSSKAAEEFRFAVWDKNGFFKGAGLGGIPRDDLIEYAYALVTKYSEGSTEAACELYDAIAALSQAKVPPAVPAPTPTMQEVAKNLNGLIAQTANEEMISSTLGKMVKQAGQDTTLQNAKRDGAEVAWIPHGMTCAFCLTLASRGWEHVTGQNLKDGHATHIHANCDCSYAVRFNGESGVAGYDPDKYKKMYYDADGNNSEQRINSMRRDFYKENADRINAQKRSAYAKRKEREASAAEEINVN